MLKNSTFNCDVCFIERIFSEKTFSWCLSNCPLSALHHTCFRESLLYQFSLKCSTYTTYISCSLYHHVTPNYHLTHSHTGKLDWLSQLKLVVFVLCICTSFSFFLSQCFNFFYVSIRLEVLQQT